MDNVLEREQVYSKLAEGLKPTEFFKMCMKYKQYFTNYFEVVIAKDGTTYFAAPSHDAKLRELATTQHKTDFQKAPFRYGFSDTIISAYGYVCTHYNLVNAGAYLTDMQKRALRMYCRSGLISGDAVVTFSYDYQQYMIAESFDESDSLETKELAWSAFEEGRYEDDLLYRIVSKKDEYAPITVYRADNDEVSFKYTKSMEASIVSENDNYFSIDYIEEIERLPKYKKYSDYNPRLGCFTDSHVANCDYPKDKFYYKVGGR